MSVWLDECLSCRGDRGTETIENPLYRIGEGLRIVAGEQETNGVHARAVENEGARVATPREWYRAAGDDYLVYRLNTFGTGD